MIRFEASVHAAPALLQVPPMPGMEMSRTMRSGRSRAGTSIACAPSFASPTTWQPGPATREGGSESLRRQSDHDSWHSNRDACCERPSAVTVVPRFGAVWMVRSPPSSRAPSACWPAQSRHGFAPVADRSPDPHPGPTIARCHLPRRALHFPTLRDRYASRHCGELPG
jgi:hypothetical protein